MKRWKIARFPGDPTGYRFANSEGFRKPTDQPFWITVFVGITDNQVLIDLSKAYVIEETD